MDSIYIQKQIKHRKKLYGAKKLEVIGYCKSYTVCLKTYIQHLMEFFAAFYSRENVQVKIYCLDNILANNESAADTFYSLQTPS